MIFFDSTFFRCLWQSLAIVMAAAIAAFGIFIYLKQTGNPIGQRVLDPVPLALVLLTTVLNHVVFAEAVYLRAHKKGTPFMWIVDR